MKKLIVCTFFALLFALSSSCALFASNHLSKKEIFQLVIQNEELLQSIPGEIHRLPFDIVSISTIEKSPIYFSESDHIQGLYICRWANGELVYENIENDIFKKALELEGLLKIWVHPKRLEFFCGGKGLGISGTYYGFNYYLETITSEQRFFSDYKSFRNGWLCEYDNGGSRRYTEKIQNGFYYYEEST